MRQRYTSKERDDETGLDYFISRYYSSAQGRYTSPDEFKGGAEEIFVLGSGDQEKQAVAYADITSPQTLNKYQYCLNNPLRYVDPDGHQENPPQHKGIVDSLNDEFRSMVRQAKNPEAAAYEKEEEGAKGPAPWVLDGDKARERTYDSVGTGMKMVVGALEIVDPTGGAVTTLRGAVDGNAKGMVLGVAGMLLGPFGREGSAPAREAVNVLKQAGTHEAIEVAGKTVVPTRQVAEKLIASGKGVIDRVERGHIGGVGHPYPHINYTTAAGEKATIRIQSVGKQFYRKVRE